MKHRQKVWAGAAITVLLMAAPGVMTAYAGWDHTNGEWRYLNSEGNAVTDQWKSSGDDWFYLNSAGVMERNSFFQVDDDYFYVDEDGQRVKNQWLSFSPEEVTANDYDYERYWYYFGSDGKAYRKKSNTFKKTIADHTYIFDEDGIMLMGFINEEGELIDEEDPFIDARYYCGEDGIMYRNQWLNYDYQGESDADLRSSMAARDYMDYESVWLYFDSDGKKVRSRTTEKVVQRTIDGETYGFDEHGVMMAWWSRTATESNASEKFYSGHDGGKLLKSTWVWMYPSEDMDEDDYSSLEYSWWRTDDNGKVYKDRIREVEGQKYAFDDIGRVQTGFLLFDGTNTFVAQYDIDTWESDDFKDGLVYGIEKADLYLFGPDELNGGAMQKGEEIHVELSDGVYTFGFGSNGKAYGTRNKLARHNDRYYINGLRLEAHQDLNYGVVKVNDNEYKVVNTSGKIQKGNRKVVKDTEDGWYIIIGGEFKAYVSASDKPRWYNGPDGEGYYMYDSKDKDNKYGDFIAGKDTEPSDDGLLEDARLNFE